MRETFLDIFEKGETLPWKSPEKLRSFRTRTSNGPRAKHPDRGGLGVGLLEVETKPWATVEDDGALVHIKGRSDLPERLRPRYTAGRLRGRQRVIHPANNVVPAVKKSLMFPDTELVEIEPPREAG